MAHVRQQIRSAAITALTGLASTGDNVHGVRGHAIGQGNLPALIIRTPAESRGYSNIGADPALLRQVSLTVLALATGGDSLDDDLDQIAVEVEAALAADVTLGGVCNHLVLVATEFDPPDGRGETISNALELTFQVEYQTARSDPETSLVVDLEGPAYEAESAAYFAAMAVAPDAARKAIIDALVVAIKAAGIWEKITALYLFAAHDSQAGLVNLVDPSNVADAINGPTFAADVGYSGDGVDQYIDSGFVGTDIDRADNSLFVYAGTLATSRLQCAGYNHLRHFIDHGDASVTQAKAGGIATSVDVGIASANEFVIVRRTGLTQELQVDNVQEDSDATTDSTTGEGGAITFLTTGSFNEYSDGQFYVGGFALYLDTTESTALYDALTTYLTAIGAL